MTDSLKALDYDDALDVVISLLADITVEQAKDPGIMPAGVRMRYAKQAQRIIAALRSLPQALTLPTEAAIRTAIGDWWNDGPRKTWRDDFENPDTRSAWFGDLVQSIAAIYADAAPTCEHGSTEAHGFIDGAHGQRCPGPVAAPQERQTCRHGQTEPHQATRTSPGCTSITVEPYRCPGPKSQ